MRKRIERISLLDACKDVTVSLEEDKPKLFRMLDERLDRDEIIPDTFYRAFYQRLGRNREYEPESFPRALFLPRIFHYIEDSQLLNTLR